MQCLAYCIAHGIQLNKLEKALKRKKIPFQHYQGVTQVELPMHGGMCFYFNNGTFVTWNIKKRQLGHYIRLVRPFCERMARKFYSDGYVYSISDKVNIRPHEYFNVEILTLDTDQPELKLALSYGFSQSIKLYFYERVIESLIAKYSPILGQLAERGKMSLSRKMTQQIMGKILEAKSLIYLKSEYVYQPRFFWQHPNLESYYLMLERYLDITERLEGLNQQLDTLSEVFAMLHDHLEARHSHFLEVVIIVLIAVEIIFGLLNIHLNL